MAKIKDRLEYLRQQIRNENISYSEIVELQGLAEHIDPSDVELLPLAGIEEGTKKYKIEVIVKHRVMVWAENEAEAVKKAEMEVFEVRKPDLLIGYKVIKK